MAINDLRILTIQKFIFLLDDFCFQEFAKHLNSINAALPLKLIKTIRQKLPAFDTHEALGKKVYGGLTKKQRQSFNQLSSYTLKLSGHLAQNYPGYLLGNIITLQKMVNSGKIEEAGFLADCLLSISEHVEDFQTQIIVLKFLIQQAYLTKDITTGSRLSKQLEKVLENEKISNQILAVLRTELDISTTPNISAEQIEDYKKYFQSYNQHTSISLQLLSKFALVYTTYYFQPELFSDIATQKFVADLGKEIDNYGYIVTLFLFDMKSNFNFFRLNSTGFNLSTKEGKKDLSEFIAHYNSIIFWKHYLNIPEIYAITVQASHYLSNYHYSVHRHDYHKIIPAADLKKINELAINCEELLSRKFIDENYRNDLISLKMLYGGLLILSGKEQAKKGVDELETMLTSYQQISLSGSVDSIFVCLMIGYFTMARYDKCAETFKRYLKITRGKPVYDDNDITIHTYYYLAQLLDSGRNQYVEKLQANYKRSVKSGIANEAKKAIEEFVAYFNLSKEIIAV